MNNQEITKIIEEQKKFFHTGQTKSIEFRIKQLKNLLNIIKRSESEIINAIKKDIGRHEIDAYVGDISPIKKSINFQLKNIKKWTKHQKVGSMPFCKSFIQPEPLGNVLIISPWNYPILTALDPLIGAISAGNCAIVKPSELSSNSAAIINKIISDTFSPEYIKVIEGGVEETNFLIQQKFDHIFFTGSTNIGKIVYESASKNLIPVTLELGGKSPCIIDKNTDIKKTAKRIIWGKLFNNGQTCTAPDYAFVDETIKTEFIEELKNSIETFYGTNPQENRFYSRIICEKHFERLSSYLDENNIVYGGKIDRNNLYIEPTLILNPPENSKIMQEEIFGPILPILDYKNIDDVIEFITSRPKPLALYVFSKDKNFYNNIVKKTSSGGMCINDTIMHVMSDELPFGGVGASGIGKYHGKYSFDTFSNYKSIFKNTFLFDRDIMYPPYKFSLNFIKKIM